MSFVSLFQSISPLYLWGGAIAAALTVAVGALALKIRSLKSERVNVSTCGYVAPTPTLKHTNQVKKFLNFLLWIQVGKVKVNGKEHVDAVSGPKILIANHPHWADIGVMPHLVDGTGRYMAHGRVMSACWGMLGVWLSKAGVFVANDSIRDGGARTREAATQFLVRGETLTILPEGLTNFSPHVEEFRTGTVKIAREAAKRLGKPVALVPSYIRYGKYPGGWLAKLDRAIQFFTVFALFPLYRRHASLTVGKAITTDDLVDQKTGAPLSDEAASEYLRQIVIALDPGKV